MAESYGSPLHSKQDSHTHYDMHDSTVTSHYSPNTDTDREAMLAAIGVESAAELFDDIPEDFRFPPLDIPAPLSEFELRQELGDLAARNATPGDFACFLGAGSYRHHVPAIVRALAFRGEFLTSYTPYQPEVSQEHFRRTTSSRPLSAS